MRATDHTNYEMPLQFPPLVVGCSFFPTPWSNTPPSSTKRIWCFFPPRSVCEDFGLPRISQTPGAPGRTISKIFRSVFSKGLSHSGLWKKFDHTRNGLSRMVVYKQMSAQRGSVAKRMRGYREDALRMIAHVQVRSSSFNGAQYTLKLVITDDATRFVGYIGILAVSKHICPR